MKNIWIIIAIITLTGLFASCNNEEEYTNTHDDAYGDVILKKMKMNGEVKYLPVFFAGGENIQEEGSKVTTPDGSEFALHSFWAGDGLLTSTGNMSPEFNMSGTYTFTLKFDDGYTKTLTDVMENTEMEIPVMNMVYDEAEQTITLDWTPVSGADLYCVKLTEMDMANTKPLYKVPLIDKSTHSHVIHLDGSNGWMRPVSEMQQGTDYWVVVAAKKVESGTTVSGMSHDFQINSCTKMSFTY